MSSGLDLLIGEAQRAVECRDGLVDLLGCDDERRSQDEVADPPEQAYSALHQFRRYLVDHHRLAGDLVLRNVEGFLRLSVANELDGPKQSNAAHVADARVTFGELAQLRSEQFAHRGRALQQI